MSEIDKEKMVALTAHLEGQCVIVKNIGRKMKVSEMELVVLCNFARLGLLSEFSRLDGETGIMAAELLNEFKEAIRQEFSKDGDDGIDRLANSCVAILSHSRFEKYLVETDE